VPEKGVGAQRLDIRIHACFSGRTAMIRVKLFLAVLCLALLNACGGASSSGGGSHGTPPPAPDTVSGTVTFQGAPLAGAKVTNFLTNTNTVYQVTTTDANGHYQFTGMSVTGNVPGEYQIWVQKNGYGFYPSVGKGGRVTRADYTGQFQGNGVTDIAIYFTVIDFLALENNSVSDANFAAYDGTNPLVTLPATGQQASYAAGDDASLRKGVAWNAATRFTANPDGTVTDNLSGLVWLQDAGCLGTALWADAIAAVNQLGTVLAGSRTDPRRASGVCPT
jgi:hypothetical protein